MLPIMQVSSPWDEQCKSYRDHLHPIHTHHNFRENYVLCFHLALISADAHKWNSALFKEVNEPRDIHIADSRTDQWLSFGMALYSMADAHRARKLQNCNKNRGSTMAHISLAALGFLVKIHSEHYLHVLPHTTKTCWKVNWLFTPNWP